MSISDTCSQPAASFQVLPPPPPMMMMTLIGGFLKMYFILSFHIILQHTPTDRVHGAHNSLVSVGPTMMGRRRVGGQASSRVCGTVTEAVASGGAQ